MSENYDQNPEARSLYYVIPNEIMDDDSLSDKEKLCYALLSGYAHKEGTCFPSNEHLGNRLGISADRAGRIISNLTSHGFITKVTIPHPKQPFHKLRIITIVRNFKKVLSNGKNTVVGNVKNTVSGDGKNNVVVSEAISKEKAAASAAAKKKPAAPAAASSEIIWKEKISGTGLKEKDMLSLQKKYEIGAILKGILHLKAQKQDIQKPLAWLRMCLSKKWYDETTLNKEASEERIEENREIAKKLEKKLEKKDKLCNPIQAWKDYIVIIRGEKTKTIDYSRLDFKVQLKKELNEMGINIEN